MKSISLQNNLWKLTFHITAGRSTCPGRHLAKSIVLITCAILADQFDVELVNGDLIDGRVPVGRGDSWSFGLSVIKPSYKVPFRIRKRLSCDGIRTHS